MYLKLILIVCFTEIAVDNQDKEAEMNQGEVESSPSFPSKKPRRDETSDLNKKMFNAAFHLDVQKKSSLLTFWFSKGNEIKSIRMPKRVVADITHSLENCFNHAEKHAIKRSKRQ